jgi:hypothetical protein
MFKRRNMNICPEIHNKFTETITNIADATTNLDDKFVKTAEEIFGINRYFLSKMILSSNPSIQLIKNLSQTLENYTELPEQLNEYITQIRQHILDNPINDDNLPSFFNIICSEPIIPIIPVIQRYGYWYDGYGDDSDGDDGYSLEKMKMTKLSNEFVKDDVCTICLLQLCEGTNEVVELNCKHQYHSDCISQWLNHKCECPLCKKKYRL